MTARLSAFFKYTNAGRGLRSRLNQAIRIFKFYLTLYQPINHEKKNFYTIKHYINGYPFAIAA